MSASGINPVRYRELFIRARICPCDATRGQECRWCSGEAADEAELRGYTPRPHERTATP